VGNSCRPISPLWLRWKHTELRAIAHTVHALTWVRGLKAVASSSPPDRIRLSLEITGLMHFFEQRPFSATDVRNGKPAPDLFLLAAARSQVDPAQCIVVEDSAPGVTAAAAAGMAPIGFVGGSHTPGRPTCSPPARVPSSPTCGH
jgi:HAD superfamily hydrolase (TIGR01509 family)